MRHADHLSADEKPLSPGDLVLFRTGDGSQAYLHRCLWLRGGRVWQMGDAQGTATPIQATSVIGVAVAVTREGQEAHFTSVAGRQEAKAMLRSLRLRHMRNRVIGLVKHMLGIQGNTGLLSGNNMNRKSEA